MYISIAIDFLGKAWYSFSEEGQSPSFGQLDNRSAKSRSAQIKLITAAARLILLSVFLILLRLFFCFAISPPPFCDYYTTNLGVCQELFHIFL